MIKTTTTIDGTVTRDEMGNIIHQTFSNGSEYLYDYNDEGKPIYYKSSTGLEIWYDSDGNETHKIREEYEIWNYPNGNKSHIKWKEGIEEWFDSNGKLVRTKDSNGVNTFYNSEGDEIKDQWYFKSSDGNEAWYNPEGNDTHVILDDGYREEWWDHDIHSIIFRKYHPDGTTKSSCYNYINDKLVHAKFGNGGSEKWYDSDGISRHEKSSKDGVEKWYDSSWNVIHKKFSSGLEIWYEYNDKGLCTHEKRSDGYEEWRYETLYADHKTFHWKNSEGESEFKKYDYWGRLIYVKHRNGCEVWYEYDENGNCIYENINRGREELFYNSKGKPIHKKWLNGNREDYEYDEKGERIYEKQYSIRGPEYKKIWYDRALNGKCNVRSEDHYLKTTDNEYCWVTSFNCKMTCKKYLDGSELWYDSMSNEIENPNITGAS